jgi:flagellar protein FliL
MADHHEAEGEHGEGAPKKGKKKLIIIALLLVLLGGGGAGAYFGGFLDSMLGKEAEKKEEKAATEGEHGEKGAKGHGENGGEAESQVVYYDLPDVMANLNPGSPTPSFIKTVISLEAPSPEVAEKLQQMQPKIQDIVITYVRELRPSDLKGSAGVYRLRDELMLRINKALAPDKINNILFKELLIQ